MTWKVLAGPVNLEGGLARLISDGTEVASQVWTGRDWRIGPTITDALRDGTTQEFPSNREEDQQ